MSKEGEEKVTQKRVEWKILADHVLIIKKNEF
jgi:hypothetical protein